MFFLLCKGIFWSVLCQCWHFPLSRVLSLIRSHPDQPSSSQSAGLRKARYPAPLLSPEPVLARYLLPLLTFCAAAGYLRLCCQLYVVGEVRQVGCGPSYVVHHAGNLIFKHTRQWPLPQCIFVYFKLFLSWIDMHFIYLILWEKPILLYIYLYIYFGTTSLVSSLLYHRTTLC